jgi:hypothetical protein
MSCGGVKGKMYAAGGKPRDLSLFRGVSDGFPKKLINVIHWQSGEVNH